MSDAAAPSKYYAELGRWRHALCRSTTLSTSAKLLALVLLLDHTNYEHFIATSELIAWPAQPTLSKAIGRNDRTVRYAVAELVEAGVLETAPGAGNQPTVYGFLASWFAAAGVAKDCHAANDCRAAKDGTEGGNISHSGWQRIAYDFTEDNIEDSPERARPGREAIDRSVSGRAKATHTRASAATAEEHKSRKEPSRSTAAAPRAKAPRSRNSRAQRETALREYQPSAATMAYLSEHCADVPDWNHPRHVEKWRNWCLDNKMPRDPDASFRKWMLDEPRFVRDQQQTAPRTGQRRAGSSAHNVLFKIRKERLAKEDQDKGD